MKTRYPLFVSFCLCLFAASLPVLSEEFKEVSFKASDGGTIYANLYGEGDRAVLLAHGSVFNKESWHDMALELKRRGLRAMAIDFRGYGKSVEGSEGKARHLDVLAGVDYLKDHGAKSVSLLGGSMGGGAVAQATTEMKKGAVDRVIILAFPPASPEKMIGDKLFIVSENERMAQRVKDSFAKASKPKRLEVLPGDAHAQHVFKTDQGPRLTKLILDFLTR